MDAHEIMTGPCKPGAPGDDVAAWSREIGLVVPGFALVRFCNTPGCANVHHMGLVPPMAEQHLRGVVVVGYGR